ncbi:EscU/YscU/HrcU family type III secretion system export apparatus switch protein [Yersinia enterocolitica]|uniref:Type III secretion apparatus protein n=1 Tax=Yersinia enterocolitica serotype O:8 / biotype 1B (strain NCTC 13174 / 8081) TaxID=393305 RepID=A1JQ88_YERE8|nr:EscU/YscU/HrcU family type III secretion system export apparatus switch protein [Yersinia enterocolitica]AJJ25348.1 surface presentation of antigens protein spaS [Yersinia enterocolitica]CAL13561.1 putative type III secretion apparatus protein [Yersinia enterocolitica subsp. enterocolitica 8081]CNF72007.1 surface presentation of antigens protein SpaS [Yersinia enterocolitica]CRY24690.1 surface presentation of antigens protein SpaS [Yersinia enterocolitica]HDL8281319.1 EscU/YscU/HrcU family 
MAEKTEKPTDKKIRDSAKKGQSFKSKDMVAAVVLVSGAFAISGFSSLYGLGSLLQRILLSPSDIGVEALLDKLYSLFLQAVVPVLLACFLPGAIISLLQSRFRLATEAVKIDFSHLNPISGFKKIFALRSLKELVKAFLYLLVFATSAAVFFIFWRQEIFMLYRTTINGMISQWAHLCITFIMVFLAVALLILLIDTLTEFFLFMKDLKMEKQEVKKEYKDNDGDPHIKSARRGLHQEILSEDVKSNVRSSTFVMANPTHIAMVIYYNGDIAPVPYLMMKTRGLQAKAVIAYAESQGVPVVRDIPVARQLWRNYCKDSFINDQGLDDVMHIINWLVRVELVKMGIDVDAVLEQFEADNAADPLAQEETNDSEPN